MMPYSAIIVDQDATPPQPAQPPAPPARDEPKGGGGAGTAVAAAPAKPRPQTPSKPLDQYKVLLHNDDTNEMMYVVRTIVEVVPMAPQRAFTVMAEAHQSGVALVIVTHLELAELYRDRFQSKGLTATIEKA